MNINEFLTSNGGTGHLSKQEKAELLKQICDNYGLNPALLPFNFISFQNQEKLYLTKNGCDQIANIRNLSRDIVAKDFDKETLIYTITAKVSDNSRSESATACVFCGKYNEKKEIVRMSGLELANKLMSVETKAKRRATLAFIGFPYEEDAVADYDSEIKKTNVPNTPLTSSPQIQLYTSTPENKKILASIFDKVMPKWRETHIKECTEIARAPEILKVPITELEAYIIDKLEIRDVL